MTASPQVNGRSRPAMPVFGDWQAVPVPAAPPESPASTTHGVDPRAEAEAEAIRREAEAKAEAIRIKAEADAEKQRLANDRNAMRLEKDRATNAAKIAEERRKREEAERATRHAREAEARQREAEAATAAKRELSSRVWFWCALGFAVVCAIVALPVQVDAFYRKDAPWLAAAPFFLEGGAWVVLQGARAAVEDRRPCWHYRTIAWLLACIAAGVNLWHGLAEFDTATAVGAAFASIAGPGVWDLHEHGRIRKRDGRPSRRQARRSRKADTARAKHEAAREAARQKAMEQTAEKLAKLREEEYPEEWRYAQKLRAALGETTVTDAVWERAWDDLHAAKPSVTVDAIRRRNAAARRLQGARCENPETYTSKVKSTQRDTQVMPASTRPRRKPVPPRRKRGDTPKFHPVARSLAAESKRGSLAARRAAEAGEGA